MAFHRLRIAAIAALLAALTAFGCTAEAEQLSVSERVIDCDIESMDTFDDPVDGTLEHIYRVFSAALDDPDSEAWRCELLAASAYARLLTREDMNYDGTIFADGLVAAAHARTWPDAQRVISDALARALGPDGIERLEERLRQVIDETQQQIEEYQRDYRQWGTDEQN